MDISVIIPTYQPGEYIWQCLDSLLRQSLSHERYEVIIVLNGCNEPYNSRLSTYISGNKGQMSLTLVQTDQAGVSNARNIGIDMSKGKYIVFIDDDDWVSDNYLENLFDTVCDDCIAVANVCNIDEKTGLQLSDYLSKAYRKNADVGKATLLTGRSFLSCSPCKIIPRQVIADRRFNTRFSQSEDALFMASISKNIKGILLCSPDTIYYRRTREGSVRHTRSRLRAVKDTVVTAVEFLRIYVSDTEHYNFPFFMTRILGLVKNFFRTH